MEKRRKSSLESGALIFVAAGILIAVNALSALGVYARKDVTKSEKFTLSKGSGAPASFDEAAADHRRYVSKGLPKLDAFVRDLRDLMQEYKNAGGGKFDYSIIEAKDEETRKKAKEAGLVEQPFGEASDTDEKAAVTQGFMGLVFKYGEQKDAIKFLPPDRTDGLEFWITNKIREIRDKGDDIHHKIGVLTGHDEIKPSDNNLMPSNMGKFSMQGDHHAELPVLLVRRRRPEGRRQRDRRRRSTASHHAARQGPHREGAAPHRPVRDEGQVARRLRQRRERQGVRRDDERDAEHARPRQAARRLRHRR